MAAKKSRKKPPTGKPICSTCGAFGCVKHDTLIEPDDPRWVNAVRNMTPPARWVDPPKPSPPKVFDPPSWAAQVARSSFSWENPPVVTYVGTSRLCSAKAGKRRNVVSHQFRIESDPLPFAEETVFLWHGTALYSAERIVRDTFRPSSAGLLGPGVYLGDLGKARNYVRGSSAEWGVLLYVEAALGRVGNAREVPDYRTTMQYDTIHAPAGGLHGAWGGSLRRREWCVRNPARVRVREVHIVPVWAAR